MHKDFEFENYESIFKEGKHKLNGISDKLRNLKV